MHLLEQELLSGVSPEQVAYVSFTRKAVEEARGRAAAVVGGGRSMDYFRTIHSLCFSECGRTKTDMLSGEHMIEIGQALGITFGGGRVDETTGLVSGDADGDKFLFLDGLARARCVSLQQQWREYNDQNIDWYALDRTARAVNAYKRLHGLRDFTDLLEEYVEQGSPLDIKVAFVDEAQDLSPLQWKVLQLMLSQAERVYIAGDDDQAIYRWSGADVDSFLQLGGEREVLQQSWRCPVAVRALAGKIVGRIKRRIEKSWAPKKELGSVEYIHELEQLRPQEWEGNTLLLARNTYMLGRYVTSLITAGVPYLNQAGYSSVPDRHVRGIQAWEALRAGKFISAQDARLVYDLTTMAFVKRGFKSLPDLKQDARVNLEMLQHMHGFTGTAAPWYEILKGIGDAKISYYRSILRHGLSLSRTPTIQLQTIHGVKGGEADTVVVMPDMAKRTWEGYEAMPDDEHRVAYVAVSRAKKNLLILPPVTNKAYPYE